MNFSESSGSDAPALDGGLAIQDLIAAVDLADSAAELLRATRRLANALADRGGGAAGGPPPPEAALTCLVRILGFNNPGAAVAAVDGLIACGPPAVAILLEGLDAHNYGARAWAVRALAGIGDVRGLDLLEQALAGDIGPSVRRAAAIGLGTLKVDHLAATERTHVQQRALRALQAAHRDGEWVVRYAVATALEALLVALQGRGEECAAAVTTLSSLADIQQEDVPVVRLRARLALTRHSAP